MAEVGKTRHSGMSGKKWKSSRCATRDKALRSRSVGSEFEVDATIWRAAAASNVVMAGVDRMSAARIDLDGLGTAQSQLSLGLLGIGGGGGASSRGMGGRQRSRWNLLVD